MAPNDSTDPKAPASEAIEVPTPSAPQRASQADRSMGNLRILLMAIAVVVVGFFLYRELALDGGNAAGAGLAGGKWAADYGWEVVSPEGTPVNLADYKGRPILLNVWATWCGPCLMEMPSLIALADQPELKEAGVAVLLVSTDGDLEPVQRFLARTPVGNAKVLVAAEMPPRVFSTAGIPATFLIAPDGKVVRREVGAMDWNTPKVIAELVGLAGKG